MGFTHLREVSLHTTRIPIGSVKKLYTERADPSEDAGIWVEGPRRPEESASFDHQGRVVEFIMYSDGLFWRRYSNRFDLDGNLLETTTSTGDGTIINTTNFAYGSQGKRTSHISQNADGTVLEMANYAYGPKGELSEFIARYPNGALKVQRIRTIGRDGVVTDKSLKYSLDGLIESNWVRVDDLNHRVVEQSSYDANGLLEFKWVSSYDAEEIETEREEYGPDNSLSRKYVCIFDAAGNIIKRETYSAQGDIEEQDTYTYEFDHIGNWIRKVMQRWDPRSSMHKNGPVIYRTFTY